LLHHLLQHLLQQTASLLLLSASPQARSNNAMQLQQQLQAALQLQQQRQLCTSLRKLQDLPSSYIFSSFFYELLVNGPSKQVRGRMC
jgi:hypothetical protein